MNSVWLVERGEYSDYGVEAIFSTEVVARAFAANMDGSSVREWMLDTWREEQITWEFGFDLQGNIVEESKEPFTELLPVDASVTASRRFDQDLITITVNRGSREAAVKIASEWYVRIRAHLDEADERMTRTQYDKIGNYRWGDALNVARILAGID